MLSKEARHDQEHKIFQCRSEPGIQVFREWLYDEQGRVNSKWPSMTGEDLTRLQGEAGLLARLLKMIEKGPSIPQQTKEV